MSDLTLASFLVLDDNEVFAATLARMLNRRGFHAVAVPLKRHDGTTIAALCVAAWVEDSPVDSFAEKYLADLRDEAKALQPQLL